MPYNDFRNSELPQHTNLDKDRLKRHRERIDLLSTVDDGNAVAEQVGLVHEVGGEKNHFASFPLFQNVPKMSSAVWVDSSGGFVKEYKSRISNKGDSNAEFSFLAS